MRNLYEVLGVPKEADQATIRKAYKKLARQYHPDLNKDPKAADRFKEISAAYEVLEDEGKRALYDEFGETSLRPGLVRVAAVNGQAQLELPAQEKRASEGGDRTGCLPSRHQSFSAREIC